MVRVSQESSMDRSPRLSSDRFFRRSVSSIARQTSATSHAEKLAMRRKSSNDETVMESEGSAVSMPDGVDVLALTDIVDVLRRDLLSECQALNLKLEQITSHIDARFAKWLEMSDSSWLHVASHLDASFAKWLGDFQTKTVDSSQLNNTASYHQPEIMKSPGLRCTAQESPGLFHKFEKMPTQRITPKECPKECDSGLTSPPQPIGLSFKERPVTHAAVEVCGGCGASIWSEVPNQTSCWECRTRKGFKERKKSNESLNSVSSTESSVRYRWKAADSLSVESAVAPNQVQTLSRTRRRGRFAQAAWLYLEDPQLVCGGVTLGRMMFVIVLASCFLIVVQTLESPPVGRFSEAVLGYVFDTLLSVEIIVRFMVCPNRCYFWTQGHNWIDLVNGPLILIARTILLFVFSEDAAPRRTAVEILNSSLPVLRLLRLLRRFDGAHLIYKSFQLASEALPVLFWVLAVIITTFSSILYAAEPRTHIASLPEAWWLTVVTVGTVGYGDVTPVTPAGKVAVCIMVIVSALYMAMPIGIIGKVFAEVWDDRSKILAVQLARRRLKAMGYTCKEIPSMFLYFDWDKDGKLSVTEFTEMMQQMQFDISGQRATELFHTFDTDGDGYIEDREFLKTLFPESITEIYGTPEENDASEFATGAYKYAL